MPLAAPSIILAAVDGYMNNKLALDITKYPGTPSNAKGKPNTAYAKVAAGKP